MKRSRKKIIPGMQAELVGIIERESRMLEAAWMRSLAAHMYGYQAINKRYGRMLRRHARINALPSRMDMHDKALKDVYPLSETESEPSPYVLFGEDIA